VRITASKRVKAWSTAISGACAFAIAGQNVLLYGGYPPHDDRCVFAELADSSLANVQECRLVLPTGEQLQNTHIIGRGPALYAFDGARWYHLRIASLT
jgi:hypothetical protein